MITALVLLTLAAAPADEVNAASYLSGARFIDAKGNPVAENAGLIDGTVESQHEPGLEAGKQPMVIELAEVFDLSRAEVVNSNNEEGYPGISVKKMKLEWAPKRAGPWAPLADLTVETGSKPQSFKAEAKGARYVRVTLLENNGSAEWIGLSELRLFGARTKPREKIDFTGYYSTSYGEMHLEQVGQRITGCYGGTGAKAGDATVEGTLEGPIFSGSWTEGKDAASAGHGAILFALTQEGNISGVWGDASGNNKVSRWDGTKKKSGKTKCLKPEASIGNQLEKEGRVVLRGILFDTGKDVIRPESVPVLEALAKAIKDHPGKYVIEGHTDDRGGQAPNQTLSEKRAASVKTWLTTKGVPADGLQTKGFGMSKPAMPNESEAGRAANRRVEVAKAE